MGKNNVSPDNRSQCDLFDLMRLAGMDNYQIFGLQIALDEIERDWRARRDMPKSYRKELRKFRANTAKRRELRKQWGPGVREAIAFAGWRRENPNADERELRSVILDRDRTRDIDPAQIEEWEDRDIEFAIESTGDYRKRQVRKFAAEPFLRLLKQYEIVPHPKRLPLSRMTQAFFDRLGTEQTLRPTDSSIRTIARDLRKRDQRD
jgi:hypothetical protein